MTSSIVERPVNPERLLRAKVGIGLIVIGDAAFLGLVSLDRLRLTDLGRAVVILGLCYLVARGRRWASGLLAFFCLPAGLIMGFQGVKLGVETSWGILFVLAGLLYLIGYGTFYFAGGSKLFESSAISKPAGA